jgi:predicted transcriptional regulator
MDVIYRLKEATVSEVLEQLADPPSYSAVRALMNILETKGHLRHEQRGPRYTYLPVVAPEQAQRSALKSLVRTFFGDSPREAIAALLELPDTNLTKRETEALAQLIRRAKKEGR